MSLTSYRAAPPRVNRCFALVKVPGTVNEGPALFAWLASSVPKASLEGNPGAKPLGCEAYVPTRAAFGKGRGDVFFDFMTVSWADFRPVCRHNCHISPSGHINS